MRITTFLAQQRPTKPSKDKATPPILDHVRIASPCRASWEQMAGDERVRHCVECKLNVYNLSEMTRLEAERLINRNEGRLCVRFYRRNDGTILTRDCPKGLRAVTIRASRIAGAILSAMMAAAPAFGQSPANADSPAQKESKDTQLEVDVIVVDPANALIPNAKVTLCRCKDHLTTNLITDSSGVARFRGLAKGTYRMEVRAPGFKHGRQDVTVKKTEQIRIKLQIAVQTITIDVKAEPVEVMGTMVGILTTVESPLPPTLSSPGRAAPLR